MKAVGYKAPLQIHEPDALVDIELPKPTPSGRDILVEIKAVSVNPVDYKFDRVMLQEMETNGKFLVGMRLA